MTTAQHTKSYARIPSAYNLPGFIDIQLDSFKWLKEEGIRELLNEVSPITSFNGGMNLYFPGDSVESQENDLKFWFGEPKFTVEECVDRDLTYSRPFYVSVLLAGNDIKEPIKQEIFMGDFPEMTENGTFIINGSERVVVSQLIRSPGVYFEAQQDRSTGHVQAMAKLIPDRGAWMEFETRKNDYLVMKFNRKYTVPVTVFLRALAALDDGLNDSPIKTGSDEEILALFAEVDKNPDRKYIEATFKQEPVWDTESELTIPQQALIHFFHKIRPGDPLNLENAEKFVYEQLFDQKHYDLEKVGRYKLNEKLNLTERIPVSHRNVTGWDVVELLRRMIRINNGELDKDDIDHLGNRRVKTVGELIANKLRVGFRRMDRVIKERMSIHDQDRVKPISLVNIRPVTSALREFYGSSQLSQFMDQNNPLAELRHKRTLSALGPGGLRRERAGFDVRDVHHTHYGRICPIETPEGPNIGLIGRLANYAKVNEYGFIETPYRKVYKSLSYYDVRLIGRTLREDIEGVGEEGDEITQEMFNAIQKRKPEFVLVVPFVSDEVEYLSANSEDQYIIAQSNTQMKSVNGYLEFDQSQISARHFSDFITTTPEQVDYMDVAPQQVVGVSASLIPFLEHDDANRALMGSNMQAQAVPLINPDIPLVSTGMEAYAALDSGQVLKSRTAGEVVSATANEIIVRSDDGTTEVYPLRKYQRSNQSTCIDQRPAVKKGEKVIENQVLADCSSTVDGQMSLGQNVVVAFTSWEGGNFEDAILISERVVMADKFTSVHIEKHEHDALETKLGPEEITRDIPNVGEDALKDLDENGIIRIGAEVGPGDILVGKITPKGEKELTPEERLLRAIFGEKSRDVKDNSMRMPHGERGKVVDVKVFTREDNTDLPAGVNKRVRVSIAQRRKLTAGDKMAGRHGNKGVVSRVVPVEDMPYLPDGTPVDIILNPLGVPGRMNIGQVLEVHLGWAALRLGFRAITPVFDGATEYEIESELARAWMLDKAWDEIGAKSWDWVSENNKKIDQDPKLLLDSLEYNDKSLIGRTSRIDIDGVCEKGQAITSEMFTKIKQMKESNTAGVEKPIPDSISVEPLVRIDTTEFEDDDELRRAYIVNEWLADRHLALENVVEETEWKHLVFAEWLRDKGYDPETIIDWENVEPNAPTVLPKDKAAIIACLKLWIEAMGETSDDEIAVFKSVSVNISLDDQRIVGCKLAEDVEGFGKKDEVISQDIINKWKESIKVPVYKNESLKKNDKELIGCFLAEDIEDLGKKGDVITQEMFDGLNTPSNVAGINKPIEEISVYKTEELSLYDQRLVDCKLAEDVEGFGKKDEVISQDIINKWKESIKVPVYQIERLTKDDKELIGCILAEDVEGFGKKDEVITQEMFSKLQDIYEDELRDQAAKLSLNTGQPVPIVGKQILMNGKSGEPFDQPVTVGVMTMLKLHHLVEDKVHARSTGPYSLVTQQPLGGKAQFGGQRFGEMEVWALEAYGASHTLQEMLTVKSDDIQGRVATYESIVKGKPIQDPGLPASFRVLIKELQSLGLAVEAVLDTGDVVKFGKDEERVKTPKVENTLLSNSDDVNNQLLNIGNEKDETPEPFIGGGIGLSDLSTIMGVHNDIEGEEDSDSSSSSGIKEDSSEDPSENE